MAKLVGLIGTGSGKVGNVVLAKGANGETIARAYQPQVSNPKSAGQSLQRAKINLVGQVSGLISTDILRSFGGSPRQNRAQFLRRALGIVSATSVDGVFTAKFNPAELQLSAGVAPMVASAGAVALAQKSITLPLTAPAGIVANKYGERLVAIVYKDENSTIPMGAFASDVIFETAGQVDVVINMPWQLAQENVITLYRIPFEITESGASLMASRVYATPDEVIAALTRRSSGAVSWGDTVYAGTANFTRTQKSKV